MFLALSTVTRLASDFKLEVRPHGEMAHINRQPASATAPNALPLKLSHRRSPPASGSDSMAQDIRYRN